MVEYIKFKRFQNSLWKTVKSVINPKDIELLLSFSQGDRVIIGDYPMTIGSKVYDFDRKEVTFFVN